MLIILALIAIVAGTMLVNTFGASAQQENRTRRTEASLAQAKEALTFYAASYADTHTEQVLGYLPCPDNGTTDEGTSATSSPACGAKDITALGRLPWKTLGLPDLRDGNGECLWYAVSGNFKANLNKTDLMNWDTNGLITVLAADGSIVATGNTPAGAVAVIFSPGPAIGNQSRAGSPATPICGGNYTAANYLDASGGTDNATLTGVANGVDALIAGAASNTFNDRLVFITARDIFDAVERRQHVDPENPSGARLSFAELLSKMVRRTAECLAYYPTRNRDFGAAQPDRRMAWTTAYPFALHQYGQNPKYDDSNGDYFGHVPKYVNTSDNASQTNSLMIDPVLVFEDCDLSSGVTGWASAKLQWQSWWHNWKDHLYYTVSKDFAPDGDSDNTQCSGSDCVTVNGAPYAGIVFFGGKRLPLVAQDRSNDANASTSTKKSNVANYLEGANATVPMSSAGKDGKGNYQTGAETGTFNDVLYCIRQDLSVIACP